jgi:integrase
VKVRGKRSNHDPIGIDGEAYALIMQFVTAWNDSLADDDRRRITPDVPIFQPLLRGSHIADDHDVFVGLSARAILMIVERRTAEALGTAITAHDMRRTCAYQMRSNGFEWDQIRAQLRHRSIGTTEKYVGREQDLSRALLSKRVSFTVPHDLRLNLDGAA